MLNITLIYLYKVHHTLTFIDSYREVFVFLLIIMYIIHPLFDSVEHLLYLFNFNFMYFYLFLEFLLAPLFGFIINE